MAITISLEALKNRLAEEADGLREVRGDRKDELYAEGRVDALSDLIEFLENTVEDDEL